MKTQRGHAAGVKIRTATGNRRIGPQPRQGDIGWPSSFGSTVSVLEVVIPGRYLATRHGENSGHFFSSPIAHSVDLSAWQVLHEFGIFRESVSTGEMNLNV